MRCWPRPAKILDPLGDVETDAAKNRARVGSARPSSLLYTYGPGAIMDLPGFSVMPAGLDDWDRIWARREHIPMIVEPRLLQVVRMHLGDQVDALRPFPWQPKRAAFSKEGTDLGIPARVFPQWFRCTGCDYLGPLPRFSYTNTHPYRPDLAQFTHRNCPGRGTRSGATTRQTGEPRGSRPASIDLYQRSSRRVPLHLVGAPRRNVPQSRVAGSEDARRQRRQERRLHHHLHVLRGYQGHGRSPGRGRPEKLPHKCRGRHPHLNAFDTDCDARPALIMMGASNLWFGASQSIIVMPRNDDEKNELLADRLRADARARTDPTVRHPDRGDPGARRANKIDLTAVSDDDLATALAEALAPPETEEQRTERRSNWDPVELLIPEWRYLQKPALFPQQANDSGLMVTEMPRGPSSTPASAESWRSTR